MPKRIILIGTEEPGLKAGLGYLKKNQEAEIVVLYPDLNPLPEYICNLVEQCQQDRFQFQERLRAISIDKDAKRVMVRNVISGAESTLDYDKLILSTGSAPMPLDVPGEHLGNIIRINNYEDARRVPKLNGKTVIVGSGINLMMTISALSSNSDCSFDVIIPEESEDDEHLSDNLTEMVLHQMESMGIRIHRNQKIESITRTDGHTVVNTHDSSIVAKQLINCTPNRPVTQIAVDAGLKVDHFGGVVVDADLRSSDKNIFACGSCAAYVTPVCRKPIPGKTIRSSERRQIKSLIASLEGKNVPFTAPAGAYALSIGGLAISGTGLTVAAARKCGFTPMSATIIQFDRAHFMPEVELMTLELVFDGPTRRVLGVQGLSKSKEALCGRVSAISGLLATKPTIDDVANLEIAYSPPFASAMDILNAAANVADNMLEGYNKGITPSEFQTLWEERETCDSYFLDCRELGNARPFIENHPLHWNHIPQGEIANRLKELPKNKRIVLICNTGARSYEAQVTIKHAGHDDVVNVDGGMSALKQSGIKI